MRILLIDTYYEQFLDDLYAREPTLAESDFDVQLRRLFDQVFSVGDAYSDSLRALGCECLEIIVNASFLQARWAAEHNLTLTGDPKERMRQVVTAQISHYRPDVLFVFEWCPLGDAFLTEIKPRVKLLVGQISSPLPHNRTFAAYDLMVSSWPPIVSHFRDQGIDAEPLKLAFDARIANRLVREKPLYDVTFVGGFAPSHADRVPWLERVLQDVEVDIFGYDLSRVPPGSPIHSRFRGPAWGWEMYDVLRRSRITLNLHANIEVGGVYAKDVAANMRLYEATGVGTCLVTEQKDNLTEMFEPGKEVVTFKDFDDCANKVRYLLDHDEERTRIAEAGRRRTLRDHTYLIRMAELADLIRRRL